MDVRRSPLSFALRAAATTPAHKARRRGRALRASPRQSRAAGPRPWWRRNARSGLPNVLQHGCRAAAPGLAGAGEARAKILKSRRFRPGSPARSGGHSSGSHGGAQGSGRKGPPIGTNRGATIPGRPRKPGALIQPLVRPMKNLAKRVSSSKCAVWWCFRQHPARWVRFVKDGPLNYLPIPALGKRMGEANATLAPDLGRALGSARTPFSLPSPEMRGMARRRGAWPGFRQTGPIARASPERRALTLITRASAPLGAPSRHRLAFAFHGSRTRRRLSTYGGLPESRPGTWLRATPAGAAFRPTLTTPREVAPLGGRNA